MTAVPSATEAITRKIMESKHAYDVVQYAKALVIVDSTEVNDLRRKVEALTRENERLWDLVADEYNHVSGSTDDEWRDVEESRDRAIAALEGNPGRLKRLRFFERE